MRICSIYARQDGTIAHIWDMDYGSPDPDTNLVVQFDMDIHSEIYQTLNMNSSLLRWQNSELLIGDTVLLDSKWIVEAVSRVQTTDTLRKQVTETSQQLTKLRLLQAKLFAYLETVAANPDGFTLGQLDTVYAELKAELAASEYWNKRLQFLVKRRALASGLSSADSETLLQRFINGTESSQDKALIWETAEILMIQATLLLAQ